MFTREAWYERLLREFIPGYLIGVGGNPVAVEDVTIYSEPGCDVVFRPWRRGGRPLGVIHVVKLLAIGPRRLVVCDHRGNRYRLQRDNPHFARKAVDRPQAQSQRGR